MNNEMILSRQDVDFLLFDWLNIEALNQRPRFAGQERSDYEAVLNVYEDLATDLFAPHNKKMIAMNLALMVSV